MTFSTLTLVVGIGLLGPLLAWRRGWHVPVALGELAGGIILGADVLGVLDPDEPTFAFLADIGFALVMFVAGTHVPMRDTAVRSALGRGALRAAAVGVLAAAAGFGLATAFGTGHAALYGVLIASSSAALALPVIDSLGLSGRPVLELTAQIAVADTACIVALPLVIDADTALRAAVGALLVAACGLLLRLALSRLERSGVRKRVHRVSEDRRFALELRVSLVVLFAMAAVATTMHVSIMLAGFAAGLAVASVGEPRRVANQLFAVTEGFFAPIFFVWLGARIDLRELAQHPSAILLGAGLGGAALLTHVAMRVTGQPTALGGLAAAQLGVPIAAVTTGTQLGVLGSGEPAAILLGALTTIGAAIGAGAVAGPRRGSLRRKST